jgi:membrane-bound inhibitor of C-type lysozyme
MIEETAAMSQTPVPVLLSLMVLAACASPQAGNPRPADPRPAAGETIGPVSFTCDDGSEIVATFDNAPDPATVLLVRGGQQATLPQAMSASGARYVGDDITFWNKGRDAAVDWQGRKLECSEARQRHSHLSAHQLQASDTAANTGGTTGGGPGSGAGDSASGSCLSTFTGPVTELNQNYGYATTKIGSWENGARFDARGGRWESLLNYTERNNTAPIQLGADWGTNNDRSGRRDLWSSRYNTPPQSQALCFYGGVVIGAQPLNATWGETKRETCPGYDGPCAGGGYAITLNGGRGSVVEGMRVHNHHDGFVPYKNDGFIYRGNWQSYIRDDCVENDGGAEGVIENNLFDGCFVFYSNAGGGVTAAGANGTLRMTNNLVRMEPMPGPPAKDPVGNRNNLGYGEFFKVRQGDVDKNKVPQLILRDNVFAFEEQGTRNPVFIGAHVPVTECSNNTILWFGSGSFPKEIPKDLKNCFTIVTGSQAQQQWDTLRQEWIDDHPNITRI